MAKSIKVIIAGKEYSLKGDNEQLINYVANEVNTQLNEFGNRHNEESATTISVLAALNIAERGLRCRAQLEADENFVLTEILNLTDYINSNID